MQLWSGPHTAAAAKIYIGLLESVQRRRVTERMQGVREGGKEIEGGVQFAWLSERETQAKKEGT